MLFCIGALTADGQVDYEAMETLIAAAGGMELVFNMAFDELNFDEQNKRSIGPANKALVGS